jgi:Cu/Ag efflux protein CusF
MARDSVDGRCLRSVATPMDEVRQMKPIFIVGALALALALSACGGSGPIAQNSQGTSGANAATASYSATGTVTAVAADHVTISHGPVEGLGWPAMTMTFQAGDPAMLQGIGVGDRVTFQFRQSGSDYPRIALSRAT